MLKKLALVLIIAVVSLCNIPVMTHSANALSTPHIIIEGEVWLLDEQGNKIFILPDTYYAKIDNLDDNYYYITFNGISGKVEKALVSTVGYHTQAEGTMQELRIDSEYDDFVTIALKSSIEGSSEDIVLPVEDSFIFLGEYPLSEMWYCVKYNENIGYIKASRTTKPEMEIPAFIPEEPEKEEETEPAQVEEDGNESLNYFKDPSTLRILIIIGLSIPAIILIFLLFKPQKPKKRKYYYDD